MAVIVMPMVPAIASGIAFTADPLSGREDRIVIHAHWGLGEALVGGHAEGDEYRLQVGDGDDQVTLIDQCRGSKSRMTVLGITEGTELRDTPADLKSRAVLSADHVVALGKRVRDAATALDYANPCFDVEWVWDGKDFWIVQARPITARARYTYRALVGQPTIWSRGNSRDVVPDPLSPLDWSLSLLDRMLTQSAVMAGYPTLPGVKRSALRHGRLYFESSIIQWEAFDAFGVPPQSVNLMMGGQQPEISIPAPTLGERMARALRRFRYVWHAVKIRWRAKATLNRARAEAEAWRATPPQIERGELARELRERLATIRQSDDLFFLQVSSGSARLVLLDLVEKYRPGEGRALTAALLAGGEPSVTAAQGYELMQLAQIAAADPAALEWLRRPGRNAAQWAADLAPDSSFRRAFTDFLARYGHRGVYETYLHNPRWREAPGYLLDSVVGLIGIDVGGLHQRQLLISSAARRSVAEALPFGYRPLIPILIQFAVTERTLREAARSALMAHLEVIRRDLLAIRVHLILVQ